jgi:hypothetical protein
MSSSPSSTSATTSSTSSSSMTTTWRRPIKPYDAHGTQSSGVCEGGTPCSWHLAGAVLGHDVCILIDTGWTSLPGGPPTLKGQSLSLLIPYCRIEIRRRELV